MGLFNILKNGFTIEKKKNQTNTVEEINEEEPIEEEVEEEEEITPTPVNTIPTPEPTMLSSQPTVEEKRLEAANVLLGDNGLSGGATPSLIQISQPAPQPVVIQQPQIETQPAQPQIFNTHNNHSGNFDNALLGQVSANQNLLVISPQSSAEISTILTNLANGNACIVSLSKFSIPEAQRFLDYICGFVNAIGGMIMQKTASEFILAPKGVNIKNS
ncbi:MAG: cell division protein SepF [Clostridia bacterium]|nr:cell division protein SepF [Clostridia bacterium]